MRLYKILSQWDGKNWNIWLDGTLYASDPDLEKAKALALARWRAGWKGPAR